MDKNRSARRYTDNYYQAVAKRTPVAVALGPLSVRFIAHHARHGLHPLYMSQIAPFDRHGAHPLRELHPVHHVHYPAPHQYGNAGTVWREF